MIALWVEFLLNTFLHKILKCTSGVNNKTVILKGLVMKVGLRNPASKLTKRNLGYILEEKSSEPMTLTFQEVENCSFQKYELNLTEFSQLPIDLMMINK